MVRTAAAVGASALAAAYATLQVLGRRAGSRTEERAALLPGDELVHDPQMVMNHGVTINAHPDEVWPWMSQMGWHLGGYYTPHWVDKPAMLRGLKSRVEERGSPQPSGRVPLRQEEYAP